MGKTRLLLYKNIYKQAFCLKGGNHNEKISHNKAFGTADGAFLPMRSFRLPDECDEKPVIYLYPERETEVTVRLDYAGRLTCTYPTYNGGWRVLAHPDGTLTDERGQTYSYLYWEGVNGAEYDFSEGFCVAGSDTAAFLEDALSRLGLNRRGTQCPVRFVLLYRS